MQYMYMYTRRVCFIWISTAWEAIPKGMMRYHLHASYVPMICDIIHGCFRSLCVAIEFSTPLSWHVFARSGLASRPCIHSKGSKETYLVIPIGIACWFVQIYVRGKKWVFDLASNTDSSFFRVYRTDMDILLFDPQRTRLVKNHEQRNTWPKQGFETHMRVMDIWLTQLSNLTGQRNGDDCKFSDQDQTLKVHCKATALSTNTLFMIGCAWARTEGWNQILNKHIDTAITLAKTHT